MRRQAWVLERDDDEHGRDQALATAALLVSATPAALAENSFVRGLLERGVADLLEAIDQDDDDELDPVEPL